MDDHRFDELARALSGVATRRGVARAVAGGVLAALGPAVAEAAKKPKKPKKNKQTKAQGRRCRANQETCDGRCLRRCAGGKRRNPRSCRCECPGNQHDCGGTCVPAGQCCPGEKECGGGCIAEDACCPHSHHVCSNGACLEKGSGACCPGYKACPTGPGGCCNFLAGEECSDDGCCDTLLGKAVCGGRCVDTERDPKHCGGCGKACPAGQQCVNGTCGCGKGAPCQKGCCPEGYLCHHLGSCCTPGWTDCVCPSGYCVNQGICEPC